MKNLILLICLTLTPSLPHSPTPPTQPQTPIRPSPTPSTPRSDADDTLHPSAKLALANLFSNTATVLFDAGSGLILQFNILDVPPNQHETSLAATQLIALGRAVATHHNINLGGIEVIFFAGEQAPFIGFLSQPPWNTKDILVVPLSSEYIRKLAEKGQIPGQQGTPDPAQVFLKAVQDRVDIDDTIPGSGRNAIIALYGNQPTFAFPNNKGIVLQFSIDHVPPTKEEIDKITWLLTGTGVIIANEYQVPLTGIEVVYNHNGQPWLALAFTPPWSEDELMLIPLHPDYIEQLEKEGVITPTPPPTY